MYAIRSYYEPDYSPQVLAEVERLAAPAGDRAARALRGLAWCSVDSGASRDLDQLSASEDLGMAWEGEIGGRNNFV